ncbi:hypothetical protein AAFF_G00210560 [Aldrovandia affinis]|uniref:Uncharacterized protein n=1 Tax=Aldrovandia affinis TaxID=143900 RepID=A0AAD7SWK5_9TELE|nr:hypothetical protein AAFF_G00210560 [Aldrovandia affinis]
MVLYYQHFIPGCSTIAKPLFALTGGQKRKLKGSRGTGGAGAFRTLTPAGLGSRLVIGLLRTWGLDCFTVRFWLIQILTGRLSSLLTRLWMAWEQCYPRSLLAKTRPDP